MSLATINIFRSGKKHHPTCYESGIYFYYLDHSRAHDAMRGRLILYTCNPIIKGVYKHVTSSRNLRLTIIKYQFEETLQSVGKGHKRKYYKRISKYSVILLISKVIDSCRAMAGLWPGMVTMV